MTVGEGQQQITRPNENNEIASQLSQSHESEKYGHESMVPGPKNDCAGEGQHQFI
jgi:hypothetical protein